MHYHRMSEANFGAGHLNESQVENLALSCCCITFPCLMPPPQVPKVLCAAEYWTGEHFRATVLSVT